MNENYLMARSIEDAEKYISDKEIVAFDFETAPDQEYQDDPDAALDPARSHICTMSLSVEEHTGIMIPVAHHNGCNVDPESFHSFLERLLTDNKVIKIAHNLSFEAMFAYKYGIIIQEPVYDTIAAAQLSLKNDYQYRTLQESGLKRLAADLIGEPLPTYISVTAGRHFDELDPMDYETIRYSCADADFALRLYHLFNHWFAMCMPKHRGVVERIESPTAVYLGLMKYNGVPADAELMARKKLETANKVEEIRREILQYTGDINIGANCSTKDFRELLYSKFNLPVLSATETGQPALDDAAMTLLKEWCDTNKPELSSLFELVKEYRKLRKITTTYLDGYLKYINPVTGHIHPNFMPLSTDTGRFSCSGPNLQNMPRKGNDPVGIRDLIHAGPGDVLISVDYSQIELRVGAHYCKDALMLQTYQTGGDIHAATTSILFDIPYEQAINKEAQDYKERRTIAKNVNFGTFYGLYPRGLQHTLKFKAGINKSEEECAQILWNLKCGYPGLTIWQEEAKLDAQRHGYVETLSGRRRYLPGIISREWKEKSSAQRCSLNTPIQGTAADIIKLAMGRMLPGLMERPYIKPLLQIHDELVFSVPEAKLSEAVKFIKKCMEQKPFCQFDVPLVAEAAAGKSFGAMKDIEDSTLNVAQCDKPP